MLIHLPFVTQHNNKLEIIGKGESVIYTPRLVRDNNELAQINSSDMMG